MMLDICLLLSKIQDPLNLFAELQVVLDHPVERSWYHRKQMVFPAALLEES